MEKLIAWCVPDNTFKLTRAERLEIAIDQVRALIWGIKEILAKQEQLLADRRAHLHELNKKVSDRRYSVLNLR